MHLDIFFLVLKNVLKKSISKLHVRIVVNEVDSRSKFFPITHHKVD